MLKNRDVLFERCLNSFSSYKKKKKSKLCNNHNTYDFRLTGLADFFFLFRLFSFQVEITFGRCSSFNNNNNMPLNLYQKLCRRVKVGTELDLRSLWIGNFYSRILMWIHSVDNRISTNFLSYNFINSETLQFTWNDIQLQPDFNRLPFRPLLDSIVENEYLARWNETKLWKWTISLYNAS